MPDPTAPDLFADAIRDRGERTPDDAVGALGELGNMQVLPGTAANPGFGLRPAAPGNISDQDRLGREYAKALLQKYQGNTVLASAAYNAGPGRVDQWLQQFGDPRTGVVTNEDWLKRLPNPAVQGYAGRVGLGAGGQVPGSARPVNALQPPVPVPAPTTSPPDTPPPPPMADAGAGTGTGPNPAAALHLLTLLLPPTHGLRAVDYDPWAIQRLGTG